MVMAIVTDSLDAQSHKVYQANFVSTVEVALDNAYPQAEGGYDMDGVFNVKNVLYNHQIVAVVGHPFYDTVGTTGYFGVWDKATNRLKIYLQATGAEVGDDVDLTGVTAMKLTIWTE